MSELSNTADRFGEQKTIVMDAGIATENNIEMIKKKQFEYSAISGKRYYGDDFWQDCEEKRIKLSDKKNCLKVRLTGTEEESYLLCHSKAKEAKEKSIFERKFDRFEENLNDIKEGLKKKRTHKKFEKIVERIGRLKEKYGVGSLHNIEIRHKKGVTTEINHSKNPNGKAKEMRVREYVMWKYQKSIAP